MELVKNIFFNTDKLLENTNIKVSYTGSLFQNNSEEIYLHYGFNDDWKEVNEIKMEKTDLGFQAELYLPEYQILNFCFRNSNNEWDNNENRNYSFPIEKLELSLVPQDANMQIVAHKGLRKSYIWSKKIKLAIYKIIKYFPKVISGNYKKKICE